ncbi:MAG: DUF2252 family protein [Hyphomicrobium sp.]|jgi:hypothetical protein
MTTIRDSAHRYEDWLSKQLDGDVIVQDLAHKHDKMCESAFVFLRATYWRWSEIILDVCPDLAGAAQVLGVGDIHLENFGTWRDVDGRLAWGVNDFDEAARMPYALDLVRLAASALLGRGRRAVSDQEICTAILQGYRQGLQAPRAVVLDRDVQWLRELVVVPEAERTKFWKKLAATKSKRAPERYRKAIADAMPQPRLTISTAPRRAGTGSLGRPRWVGTAEWRGAPVLREAKALVVSAWSRARDSNDRTIRCSEIANGRFRPVDPWYRVKNGVVVRRLSPNNRKIEVGDGSSRLLDRDVLQMMGFELANIHLGTARRQDAIKRDLEKRKRGWLTANARKAAEATTQDYKAWLAD